MPHAILSDRTLILYALHSPHLLHWRELTSVLSGVRAVWPFEAILAPKRHVLRLTDLREEEKIGEHVSPATTTLASKSAYVLTLR